MRKSARRIRGAIGMGLTWGAAWGAAGTVLAVVTRFKADAPFPLIFAVLGFIAGVIFSAILALTEGRRGFDQMSLPRFAVWGAAGGLLLSAVFAKAASLGWGDVLVIAPHSPLLARPAPLAHSLWPGERDRENCPTSVRISPLRNSPTMRRGNCFERGD